MTFSDHTLTILSLSAIVVGIIWYFSKNGNNNKLSMPKQQQQQLVVPMIPEMRQIAADYINDGQTKYLQCQLACNLNYNLRKNSDVNYNLINKCASQCDTLFLKDVPKISWKN